MRTEAENFDETQKAYHRGYTKGFQSGYLRGISDMGKNTESLYATEQIQDLPIEALALHTRALNCLKRSNCVFVRDAVQIRYSTIQSMRNMGPKTAKEIVRAFRKNGILAPAWEAYTLTQAPEDEGFDCKFAPR